VLTKQAVWIRNRPEIITLVHRCRNIYFTDRIWRTDERKYDQL